MIKVIDGDLLEAPVDVIGHQVNCAGIMGSGIARSIKVKYPQVYESYRQFCDKKPSDMLLGLCQIVNVGLSTDKYVANLFGQQDFGGHSKQYTNIEALQNSLYELKTFSKKNKLKVGLPWKIGSVRGGASWDDVYKVIDEVFSDYEVTLYRLDLG